MLDMYRQEAMAARQESAYGAMLELRPFLFRGAPLLIVVVAAALMASLMVGRAARTVHVPVVAVAGAAAPHNGVALALAGPAAPQRGQRAVLRPAGAAAGVPGTLSGIAAGAPARVLFAADAAHAAQLASMLQGGRELRLELQVPAQGFGQWLLGLYAQRGGNR